MKYILWISLCLIIYPVFGQVVITGRILNYDGKSEIYINHAREGIHPYFTESSTVAPSTNGKFHYRFENPGIGIIRLSYRGLHYTFLHEQKGKISFELDQRKIEHQNLTNENLMFVKDSIRQILIKKIDGDHKEINRYLNKLPRTVTVSNQSVSGTGYSIYLSKENDRSAFLNKLDSLREEEFKLLSAVFDKQADINLPISDEILNYLEDEIDSYYAGIFINALYIKRMNQIQALQINPDTALTMYNPDWEILTEQFFQEFSARTQRPNSFRYNEVTRSIDATAHSYKEYTYPKNEYTLDEIILLEILDEKYAIDSIVNLEPESRYALQITKLRNIVNNQVFYSPVLKQAIDSMKKWHPGSENLEVLKPYFTKVDEYLSETSGTYEKAVVIEENYTTLDGLLEKFRGKTVLIDVWATWCHPCIGEFAYKNSLNDLLQSGELTMLYISIDKERWEKRWRENMNYNKLEGYHVLADDVLIRDMWKTLGEPSGYIPRYALIDAEGNVAISHAARPSQGDALRNQILEIAGE